jgi:thioredoxin-like negative regulator of GroEL
MVGAVKKISAILCLTFLANAHAESFSPLLDSARRAIHSGLWDVATLRLEAAAAAPDIPPDRMPELRILLAEALVRDRRPDAALAILGESNVRTHPEAEFWLGQALAGKGRFAEAADTLAAFAAKPESPHREEAAFTAANLRMSLSRPDAALEALSLVDSVESKLRRVGLLIDLDRTGEARALFPEASGIPEKLSRFANLLEGRLLLAEGKASQAEPLFASLVSEPEGQSLEHHNLAALGRADCMAAQGDAEGATEFLLAFIQARGEAALLGPIFDRIIAWLPETMTSADHPTLALLSEWSPKHLPTGSGFVNTEADSAASAWPRLQQPLTDLEAFSLHALSIGMHRVDIPTAKAEAPTLMRRLGILAPRHFLVPGSMLTLASWRLEEGRTMAAFDILDHLRHSANSTAVKGEAAFLKARSAFERGDAALASELFREAAESLEGENRAAAALNSAISALGQDPEATITVQNLDPAVRLELSVDLALERALASDTPQKTISALDAFLREHPGHARAAEARLAIAEAAIASVPPDLSLAKAQIDTMGASGSDLPEAAATRLILVRLRLLDLSGDPAATVAFANEIIAGFPGTHTSSEASLILGKNLFRSGNYNEARIALEKLAAAEPGTQRSQAALLLAARSAALGATAQSREEALKLYDKAMATDGALKSLALLEKSRLLIDLNRLPAAIESLAAAYESAAPDDPSRFSTGLLLAEATYARGDSDPDSLANALRIYDSLLEASSGNPSRFFRLQYLRGLTLEKLPDATDPTKNRLTEAREAYFSVIDRPTDPPPTEWEWFERSCFRLLNLLETEEDWKAAVGIAGRIASFGGPRAEEAATRARQLRLKHMVWDD